MSIVCFKQSSSIPFSVLSLGRTTWAHCLPYLCSAMLPINWTVLVTICLFLWSRSQMSSWKYYLPWSMIWFLASLSWAREQRQMVAASMTGTDELVTKGEILITPFLKIMELFPNSLKDIDAKLLITNSLMTLESFDRSSRRSTIALVDSVWLIAFSPSNKELRISKFLIKRQVTFSSLSFFINWGRIEVSKIRSFPSWVSEQLKRQLYPFSLIFYRSSLSSWEMRCSPLLASNWFFPRNILATWLTALDDSSLMVGSGLVK